MLVIAALGPEVLHLSICLNSNFGMLLLIMDEKELGGIPMMGDCIRITISALTSLNYDDVDMLMNSPLLCTFRTNMLLF